MKTIEQSAKAMSGNTEGMSKRFALQTSEGHTFYLRMSVEWPVEVSDAEMDGITLSFSDAAEDLIQKLTN